MFRKRGLYFVVLFLLWFCMGKSQNPLFERYNDSANAYLKFNYPKARFFADSLFILAKQANDYSLLARAYNAIGRTEESAERYDLALDQFILAEAQAIRGNDKALLAKIYNNLGVCFERKGELQKALEKHFKALSIRESLNDKKEIANSYQNIGVCYFSLKDYQQSQKYTSKAVEIAKSLNNYKLLGSLYSNLGVCYFNDYKDSLALQSYYLAIEYSIKANDSISQTAAYINIGNFYLETGKPDKALGILKKAKSIKNISKSEKYIDICNNLAQVFSKLDKNDSALSYFNEALNRAKNSHYKSKELELYDVLRSYYLKGNDFKNAYNYLSQYNLLRQQIINEKNLKTIAELETVYKTQNQAQQIALLNKENENEKLQTKNRTRLLTISIICFILACAAAFAYYRNFNRKKKDNVLLNEKNNEIQKQKELVDEKNKEILDSINYAKRLQDAILPPQQLLNKYLPNSFLLYQPKDIIAGDFYWLHVQGQKTFLAVADSTGHGVPGAMVSIVCSNALDKSVKEFGLSDTGEILGKTRELILETFEKSGEEIKDGMDISLICIDEQFKQITWSGANNPLWYVDIENDIPHLTELKADKQPVGKTEQPKPFTTHQISYKHNRMFYLFTDGYADQFGGEHGKKFKYKNMQELLKSVCQKSVSEQNEIILHTFEKWKGLLEQLDDVCIAGIRI